MEWLLLSSVELNVIEFGTATIYKERSAEECLKRAEGEIFLSVVLNCPVE